ncbi:MAG: alpha-galactosidase [Ruminococcus sp.]|nr:alpha-galactosidase [Ruminococcus sp.]
MLKLDHVTFSYTDNGERFFVRTSRSVRTDRVGLEIKTDGNVFSVWVRTDKEITIGEVRAHFEYPFSSPERLFLNGYQSWTDSYEHRVTGKMHGLERVPARLRQKYELSQYGDYNFADYPVEAGKLHGWSYGYIRYREEFDFIGSLAEDSGFTKIMMSVPDNSITLEKDCSGLTVSKDYCALKVLFKTGSEEQVFDTYFELLGTKLDPRAKPVFGYTSWYRHYQNISEDIIRTDLAGLCSQKYKPDVFQIDDGYQTAVGDWLSVDETKFPQGMKSVADMIKAEGMTAGLWLAPFVCEEKSDVFVHHKDWLLTDSHGEFVRGGSNWSGFYALDIYNKDFREHLKKVFDTVVNEWGYKLLKLDFLYAACIIPRAEKSRGTVMADGMKLLRELAGDALILGCGVPLASAFGRVDYCRIGCDVCLDWDDKPLMRLTHRERVSTRTTVLDSVFRRQLNGRAFLSDPDVFLLRSDNTSMNADQKLCLAEVNTLCGSVLFTSDNAADYGEEQLKVLDKIMAIRGARVLSASVSGDKLKLCVDHNGQKVIRIYKI